MEKPTILTAGECAEFTNYHFPFENIAFEGGGGKGIAHIGAVRVLEEIGVWKNMKRFAGTSIGSIVALFGALGMNSHEMETEMAKAMQVFGSVVKVKFSTLPNMIWRYGWSSGRRVETWIGNVLKANLEHGAKATFEDLYKEKRRELCVIVTNLTQQDCQYCHVKITPNMSIKQAVRMSISIPGILNPVVENNSHYVDGGVVNNYPLRVFDGWFLSQKPEHSLLLNIAHIDNVVSAWNPNDQFGHEPNRKTIGVLLYSAEEQEIYKDEFEERAKQNAPTEIPLPETRLARKHRKQYEKAQEARQKHEELAGAYMAFVAVLQQNFSERKDTIPAKELEKDLEKAKAEGKFTAAQIALLFKGKTSKQNKIKNVVSSMDKDDDGEISITELTKYAESQGREFRSIFRGYETREVKKGKKHYFMALMDTMQLACKRYQFERDDLYRSIGINTGYIGTLDQSMKKDDIKYLLQQGKRGCLAFLRVYKVNPVESEPGN